MALLESSLSRKLASVAAMSVFMFGAACSDDDPPTAAPTPIDVELSESVVQIVRTVNPVTQVQATVVGTTNVGVTWTSANEAIATVSQDGTITGHVDGETFVTARSAADPSVNRSVVVQVVSTVVTVAPTARFTFVGGPTRQFTATVENNANTAVTWTSSNTAVATVDQNGVVTPVTAGTAQITATSAAQTEKSAFGTITVQNPVGTTLTAGVGLPVASADPRFTMDMYHVAVPPGATRISVTISGGTGDVDLYLFRGAATSANLVCTGFNVGNTETCTADNPQEGLWHIGLEVWDAYAGATLTATVTGGS